jgi:hypothetical protein
MRQMDNQDAVTWAASQMPWRSPMSEDLLRIVYISTAPDDVSDAELATILKAARRNNLRNNITGMLVYHDQTFIQVLEGPEDAVTATFARISRNPRHDGILVPDRSKISERTFGEWSMGWIKASDLTCIGFDRDLVALRLTQNTLIDAMLKAFREVVRVE